VYPLPIIFATNKGLFRKLLYAQRVYQFHRIFSCLFNLACRITSPEPVDVVEYFAAEYTVDCLSLLRFVYAFCSVHVCFVAPLYITHLLFLFITSALQVTAIIASSASLDWFYLRFDLQKQLTSSFLPQ